MRRSEKRSVESRLAEIPRGAQRLGLCSRLDQELAKGGKVQAPQDKVNELDREVTKLKAQLEMDEGNLTDEQKRAAATQKNVQEVGSLAYQDGKESFG